MTDWRAELERERHTVPSPPRLDATSHGPTRTYDEWVQQKTCLDKRAYKHQWDARLAILQIAKRNGPQLVEYRCPFGDHWHMMSKEEEKTA